MLGIRVATALEQIEPMRQAIEDLAGREHLRARRCELNGERKAVQSHAEVADLVRRRESGSLAEESDDVAPSERRKAAMRAARCRSSLTYPSSDTRGVPVCRPTLTRIAPTASAFVSASAAATAPGAPENANRNASPWVSDLDPAVRAARLADQTPMLGKRERARLRAKLMEAAGSSPRRRGRGT